MSPAEQTRMAFTAKMGIIMTVLYAFLSLTSGSKSCVDGCTRRNRRIISSISLGAIINSSFSSLEQVLYKLRHVCNTYHYLKSCLSKCEDDTHRRSTELGFAVPEHLCQASFQNSNQFKMDLDCWIRNREMVNRPCDTYKYRMISGIKAPDEHYPHRSSTQARIKAQERAQADRQCSIVMKLEACTREHLELTCGPSAGNLLWRIHQHRHLRLRRIFALESSISGACKDMISLDRGFLDQLYRNSAVSSLSMSMSWMSLGFRWSLKRSDLREMSFGLGWFLRKTGVEWNTDGAGFLTNVFMLTVFQLSRKFLVDSACL